MGHAGKRSPRVYGGLQFRVVMPRNLRLPCSEARPGGTGPHPEPAPDAAPAVTRTRRRGAFPPDN
jgi:hypothetical protein